MARPVPPGPQEGQSWGVMLWKGPCDLSWGLNMSVISLTTEQGVLSWLFFQTLSQVQNQKGSRLWMKDPRMGQPGCRPSRFPLKPHCRHLETPPINSPHQRKQEGTGCRSVTPSLGHVFFPDISGSRSGCLHLCPPPSAISQMGELSLQGSLIAES